MEDVSCNLHDWFRDPYQRVYLVQDWIEMLSKGYISCRIGSVTLIKGSISCRIGLRRFPKGQSRAGLD